MGYTKVLHFCENCKQSSVKCMIEYDLDEHKITIEVYCKRNIKNEKDKHIDTVKCTTTNNINYNNFLKKFTETTCIINDIIADKKNEYILKCT